MTRRIITMASCICMAMALASCNTSDKDDPTGAVHEYQEATAAEMEELLPADFRLNLRVGEFTDPFYWESGMQVSLFGRAADVRDGVNDNRMATYVNGEWVIEPALLLSENSGMDIYMAYPYSPTARADSMPINALESQTFLYGRTTTPVTKYTRTSTVHMKSPLSKVFFRFRKAPDLEIPCTLTGVRIEGNGMQVPTEGLLNMYDGSIKNTAWGFYERKYVEPGTEDEEEKETLEDEELATTRALEEGKLQDMENPIVLTEEYSPYEVMFFTLPMQVTEGSHALVKFVFTVNGQEHEALPVGTTEQTFWEQGSTNVVNVTFGAKYLETEYVTIKPWNTVNEEIDIYGKDTE